MGMAGGTRGITSEINVTPLIDVVLVLLIIFMVITPMLTKGRPVELPLGQDPAKKPDSEEDIIVSIEYRGPENWGYFYNADEVPEERLKKMLTDLYERDSAVPLFLKADKRLRYGVVRDAMILCESAGFTSVALVTEAAQQ